MLWLQVVRLSPDELAGQNGSSAFGASEELVCTLT